jgi:hypothetical protein
MGIKKSFSYHGDLSERPKKSLPNSPSRETTAENTEVFLSDLEDVRKRTKNFSKHREGTELKPIFGAFPFKPDVFLCDLCG